MTPAIETRNPAGPIALPGGRGMLGADLCRVLAARGIPFVVYDLPEWDITREADVARAVEGAAMVINCAAYTDVEGAERHPEAAFAVNADGPALLARACARSGTPLIHFSTDFVFDGTAARPWSETDVPNPINVYGRSKLAGEEAVLAAGGPAVVLRIQWTYGRAGRNFVSKILERARSGRPLRVVDDQRGAPTWTFDVATAVTAVVLRFPWRKAGILHYAAEGCVSRYETARFIVEAAGLDVPVEPCSSDAFPSAAKRPANSCFDCSRFDGVYPGLRRAWDEALRAFLIAEGAAGDGGAAADGGSG